MVVWVLVVGSSRNTTEASGCWWGGVGGLLFVNYIVDASIFDAAHLVGVCGVFFDDCFVLCGV